jgi:hypothetical protein
MTAIEYGIEGIVAEDRAYEGSRFSEVRDAVFADPYPDIWTADGNMPTYDVTLKRIVGGMLPFGQRFQFRDAAARAVDSFADLRWGPDGKGFRRLVHPNGICLSGRWEISEETEYTGYFRAGSKALVLARYSTCCSETRRGHTRSLSMVGKLYPTTDPEHPRPLRTASFITQEDIGGDVTAYINDAQLLNAPNVTVSRRGGAAVTLMLVGAVFDRVDKVPSARQLYSIAELDKPPDTPTRAPAFMRLLVADDQPRIDGEGLDFRDEIMRQIFDRPDRVPKRSLRFHVDVTDQGITRGPRFRVRRRFRGWRRIGSLIFDDAVASYNGDFVLHFHHPTWRADRNDPATSTRVGERKVR